MNHTRESVAQRDKAQLTENYAGFVMAQIERAEKAKRERRRIGQLWRKREKMRVFLEKNKKILEITESCLDHDFFGLPVLLLSPSFMPERLLGALEKIKKNSGNH